MYLGELDAADALCERARALAEGELFDDTTGPRRCSGSVPAG